MKKLISVIIPTYNREKTIIKAVESVINQTYDNIEVIVIDDGSTDNTSEKMKEINDARVHYYKMKKNMGPSEARNKGVEMAEGEYIAFQDSDDVWKCDKLEKELQKFEEDENIGLCYCSFLHHRGEMSKCIPDNKLDISLLEGDIYLSLLEGNKIGTPTMLMKKEVFEKVGQFDVKLKAYEDWDLALRVSKDYKIAYVSEPLVDVYFSNNSVNNNYVNLANGCMEIINKNYRYVDDKKYFKEIIKMMFLNMAYGNVDLVSQLVPDIISTQLEYDLLKESFDIIKIWKRKYDVSMWLENNENYWRNIEGGISIYGIGDIGKKLIKCLMSNGKKIDKLIDRNRVEIEDMRAISLDEFLENNCSEVCIITVQDDKGMLVDKIEKGFKGTIINLYDFI